MTSSTMEWNVTYRDLPNANRLAKRTMKSPQEFRQQKAPGRL